MYRRVAQYTKPYKYCIDMFWSVIIIIIIIIIIITTVFIKRLTNFSRRFTIKMLDGTREDDGTL